MNRKSRRGLRLLVMLCALVGVFFLSFLVGRYPLPPGSVMRILLSKIHLAVPIDDPNAELIFFRVRLPRIISAILVGGGLSVAGCSYQGVFRNPMVSPDILGATAGAGFGAAVAMLLDMNTVQIQLISFCFGIAAVGITWLICAIVGKTGNVPLTLILAGMVVASLFEAGLSLMKYVADPYTKLPEITFWLMGSLAKADRDDILRLLIPIVIALIPLFLYRWELNLMSFSEEEARSMGVNIPRLRLVVIMSSTLISAAAVSTCGIVGWVGLVIPHLARLVIGPNYKLLIPASILLGGGYLLLVDDLARGWMPFEIPLGILTAIVGAPFFVYLLVRNAKQSKGG